MTTTYKHLQNHWNPKHRILALNNTPLKWSKNIKYLGVTISRRLNFNVHTSNIIKKSTQILGILNPILNRHSPIPIKTRLNLLKIYVNPILTYPGSALAPFLKLNHWRKLEAVQTIGIRLVMAMPTYVRNKIVLNSSYSKTLEKSIHDHARTLFYKSSLSTHRHIRKLGHSLSLDITQIENILPRPSSTSWTPIYSYIFLLNETTYQCLHSYH